MPSGNEVFRFVQLRKPRATDRTDTEHTADVIRPPSPPDGGPLYRALEALVRSKDKEPELGRLAAEHQSKLTSSLSDLKIGKCTLADLYEKLTAELPKSVAKANEAITEICGSDATSVSKSEQFIALKRTLWDGLLASFLTEPKDPATIVVAEAGIRLCAFIDEAAERPSKEVSLRRIRALLRRPVPLPEWLPPKARPAIAVAQPDTLARRDACIPSVEDLRHALTVFDTLHSSDISRRLRKATAPLADREDASESSAEPQPTRASWLEKVFGTAPRVPSVPIAESPTAPLTLSEQGVARLPESVVHFLTAAGIDITEAPLTRIAAEVRGLHAVVVRQRLGRRPPLAAIPNSSADRSLTPDMRAELRHFPDARPRGE